LLNVSAMRSLTAVLLALTACGTDLRPGSQDPLDPPPDAADPGMTGPSTSPTDGGVTGDGNTASLTDCQEATQHSDLAWIQQKVFSVSCLAGCHSGSNPDARQDLSPGASYANLVNVPSTQYSGWTRVVPGAPDRSMLMVQLGGEVGPELEGTMPWGQPKLCDEEIDAIRRWIAAGAPQ
jgi:hypothetical protein